MSAFDLPEAVGTLRDEAAALGAELARDAAMRAAAQGFPRDVLRRLADSGWGGLAARPGRDGILAAAVAVATLGRFCPRSGDAMHQLNFGSALLLAANARTGRHREWLDRVVSGRALVPIAITEEAAGAQAAALECTALRRGDVVTVDGAKRFTALSTDADAFVVYARFGGGADDIGAVVVPRDHPRLGFGEPETFMSGEAWCPLTFRSVELPAGEILFESGGFSQRGRHFDLEKIGHAARALGTGRCAFDRAVARAGSRVQFGRPVSEFQGGQWRFAEVWLTLESAELALCRAAARADAGALKGEDAAAAKLLCNRAAMQAADLAVQICGGEGYTTGSLAEYCFRRARGHMLNGGLPELMLTRVAEAVFGRRFPQAPD